MCACGSGEETARRSSTAARREPARARSRARGAQPRREKGQAAEIAARRELSRTQFDQRGRLDVLAEPRLERRLALADVFDASVLLRHRQGGAGGGKPARPLLPQLPDALDRRLAE